MRLGQDFFDQPTIELAKALLGTHLVLGDLRGKIVETEAYLHEGDPACHASRGLTARNAPMFGPAGRTYVYFIYGMYHCLNVTSAKEGVGEAVLIRALEPLAGLDLMRERRKTQKIENLCSGPGKLTLAFGINMAHNNLDLVCGQGGQSGLQIHAGGESPAVEASGRIGLSCAQDLQLRFFIPDSRFVSGRRSKS
ncbi:MAG: DNA-3-methyladenine glycosylase [Spirochaetes bacterium]|nr:DNA-3-methyladenine glycosylase [Spirochaetota bacterium]